MLHAAPASGLRISDMTVDHLPAVVAIERRSFDKPWSEGSFRQELQAPLSRMIVACAEPGDRILGYACGSLVVDEMHVLNLAVDPARRRSGVARRLMEYLLEQARESKVSSVSLEVRRDNIPACRLYESLGFAEVGVRRGYYGPGQDAIVMRRALW